MKFVPTASTCTPRLATSPATLRTSMFAPARAEEYSVLPGVGLDPAALVITRTWPSPCSKYWPEHGLQEVERGLKEPPTYGPQVLDGRADGGPRRCGPRSRRRRRGDRTAHRGAHEPAGGGGVAQVAGAPVTTSTAAPA